MNVIARNLKNAVVPAALVGLTLLSGIKANAQAITPTFTGTTVSGGITTFNYDIVLGPDSTATTAGVGADLTLFDFFGLTGTPTFTPTAAGAAFTVTTPLLGLDVPNTVIGQSDNPTAPNIYLAYTGSDITSGALTTVTLGTLSADSTGILTGAFTPFSSLSLKTSNGLTAANQSFILGPNPSPNVPEPGTIAMLMGMGISGSAFVLRRRRRA